MPTQHMPQLAGLRTIAVLLVMIGHWFISINSMQTLCAVFGTSGVNLFFVLSGFLTSLALIAIKQSSTERNSLIINNFYRKRLLRIFPLFYFVIFAGILFNIPTARQDGIWLGSYLTNIRLIQSNGAIGYLGHLWPVSVEVQFYLLFPLIFLVTPKDKIVSLSFTLIIIGVLSRAVLYFYNPLHLPINRFNQTFTLCCLDSFGFGILLSYLFYYKRLILVSRLNYYRSWLIAPVVINLILAYSLGFEHPINSIFLRLTVSIFLFWMIGTASFSEFKGWFQRFLEYRPVSYLGKISYGLYVYHYILMFFVDHYNFPILVRTAVLFVATISFASISFHLLERPIYALKYRLTYARS